MIDKNDWRLTNQGNYLQGKSFSWKKYFLYRNGWDHDHCEFCFKTFSLLDNPEHLSEGYVSKDNYYWICKDCFDDFKELFKLKII